MKIVNYIEYTLHCVESASKSFKEIAKRHSIEPDVNAMCLKFAGWCDQQHKILELYASEFGSAEAHEPDRIDTPLIKLRTGGIGLMRDLHDAWLMTSEINLCWIILLQCAKAMRHNTFKSTCEECCKDTESQTEWLLSKIKLSSSQVLTVPT
jgi:hypothetical protein